MGLLFTPIEQKEYSQSSGPSEGGEGGGHSSLSQILADTLTLFQSGYTAPIGEQTLISKVLGFWFWGLND